MSDWQPIETAPRDGTHIWLFYPEARGGEDYSGIVEACWPTWDDHDPTWRGPYSDGLECTLRHCTNVSGEPTHWMPLPEPPAIAAGARRAETEGLSP
jgi:hypothetical protein